MSRAEAKKIVKMYANKSKQEKYPFSAIYLFGSFAQNKTRKWSDIDVAIVSDQLKRNREKNNLRLWRTREGVDLRIEPHGFTVKDFQDDCDPMVYEIKKTGIRIV